MITIKLATNGERLEAIDRPIVACGDQNSVQLEVAFCGAWDGYAKTAVFYCGHDTGTVYEMILDADNRCMIPAEVLASACDLYIGLRGTKGDGSVLTSEVLPYTVKPGAPGGTETPEDPTPTVYEQIMAQLEETNAKYNTLSEQVSSWDGKMAAVEGMQATVAGHTETLNAHTEALEALQGAETKTLLWTNASPTSNFAAQTISLDLSGYDAVEIVCRYSTTDDARTRYICDVGGSSPMNWFYYTGTDGKYMGVRSRTNMSASTTGVTFDTCMGKPVNSSTSTATDGYIIPIEIYGIKGV